MKQIANKLEDLDKYFLTKSENEKWGMILVVAGAITFIAYSQFLPYAEDLLKKSTQKKARLEKNIAAISEKFQKKSCNSVNLYIPMQINRH